MNVSFCGVEASLRVRACVQAPCVAAFCVGVVKSTKQMNLANGLTSSKLLIWSPCLSMLRIVGLCAGGKNYLSRFDEEKVIAAGQCSRYCQRTQERSARIVIYLRICFRGKYTQYMLPSQGPTFGHVRRSAQTPTAKAVRGTDATKRQLTIERTFSSHCGAVSCHYVPLSIV